MKKNIYLTILAMVIAIFISLHLIFVPVSSSSRGVVRSMQENTQLTAVVSGRVIETKLEKNNQNIKKGETLLTITAEQIIQKTLNELKAQGKTMIVIAHRLSTIANSDKILVMKEGKIMEEGTHKDLLSKDSVYKSMWEKQIISLN